MTSTAQLPQSDKSVAHPTEPAIPELNVEEIERLAIQVRVLATTLLDDGYNLSWSQPPSIDDVHRIQQLGEMVHEKSGALLIELRRGVRS
jgi:hypothetical protein